MTLAGKKVLVTGAAGFLGTHLCRRLTAAGAEVHAVSRSPRADRELGLRWWRDELEDLEAARGLVASVEPDILFHLGGLTDASPGPGLLVPTFRSLLASTVHLIQAVTETGCGRLMLVGSLEEPGEAGPDPIPSSPYAAAKWAASAYGRMAHRLFGTPVVILRTFMAFGPGQLQRKIIPYTITSLLGGVPPKLTSGSRRLDWIYVDDVIEGYVRAATEPGVEGATIDIGSGTAVSIREIVERLVALIAPHLEPAFGALPDRPADEVRTADTERTLAQIGWRPRTSLESGLALTVESFRRLRQ